MTKHADHTGTWAVLEVVAFLALVLGAIFTVAWLID